MKNRQYGFDPAYSDDGHVWIDDDGNEADDSADLEKRYQAGEYELEKQYTRTCYRDFWEHVSSFLTDAAAKEFIQRNGHRYGRHGYSELRTYVESGYRNPEWIALRRALKTLSETLKS